MSESEVGTDVRAQVALTRHEFAHLWSGGVLSLKLARRAVEVTLDLSYQEAPPTRGTRLLLRRIEIE